MRCKSCNASLDITRSACPACGAEVELGRLTGILGIVCRACDAYNEPGARACAGCGKPFGEAAEPAAPPPPRGAEPLAASCAAAPAPPRAPGVRAFAKPAAGAATRFVPAAVLRASAPPSAPAVPALTPIPLASPCPRCGAETGAGRPCPRCGQELGARGTQVLPTPSVAVAGPSALGAPGRGRVRLVLEAGGGEGVERFPLDGDAAAAGRAAGAIAFPDDPCLAPHHATFLRRGGALYVRDEGAPGGVYLRLRGGSVPLRAGDTFVVGERLLRFAGLVPPAQALLPDGTRRLGSPRPPSPAVVVEECLEGGATGRVFVRSGPSVTFGRAGCAVSLADDPHVSKAHAEILLDAGGAARLRDLGSANGTYARVPPGGERELHAGDRVRLGREVLRVEVASP